MHVRSGRIVAEVAAGRPAGAARGTAGSARARSVVLGRPGAAARSCRTAAGRPSTTGASPATAYMGNPV